MKNLAFFLSLTIFLNFVLPVYSHHTESGTSEESILEEDFNQLLDSLSSLHRTLRKDRRKRPLANDIKLATRRIIRAVNSIPPNKCLQLLSVAMDDLYELVSELGSGISCGPPILPPFLPGEENLPIEDELDINCIPPEPGDFEARLQIGGPFNGAFADVHPVYNECRNVFQIDDDGTEIPDVCE